MSITEHQNTESSAGSASGSLSGAMFPTLETSDFAISLDFFSGPMDLLLHLVHQQEVDIEKVSMKLIAEQYLAVIGRAQIIDLEKASEYLVIAATLLSLKSASMLPQAVIENDLEQENSEQFYEELRARLRAYEVTKRRARALVELPQLGVDVFSRNDRRALQPTPEMLAEPEEVTSMGLLFARLLKRIGGVMSSYRVRLDSISVVSYMMKIVDSLGEFAGSTPGSGATDGLRSGGRKTFSSLLGSFFKSGAASSSAASAGESKAVQNRSVVIGSFIAVLELVKRGFVHVAQPSDHEDITIELSLAGYGPMESEFDLISARHVESPDADLEMPRQPSNVVHFPGAGHSVSDSVSDSLTDGGDTEFEEVHLKEANRGE